MTRRAIGLALIFSGWVASGVSAQAPKPIERITGPDTRQLEVRDAIADLRRRIEAIRDHVDAPDVRADDARADVEVWLKAATWLDRFGEYFAKDSGKNTLAALAVGRVRAEDLGKGQAPWSRAKGGVARGFVSKLDGSIQPYAVYVPQGYDGATPLRLDVVLHGRDASLTEVKFLLEHHGKPMPEGENGLILHVYGRGNNAYRWAGESDVFEAIDAARRNYRVDDRRIVLRGFSMGGAGAWHLGLHHPSTWCAVEAGAGFTETKNYAKLKNLPDYQERLLPVYDAVEASRNAWLVPIAGYGGEDDPQLCASLNIRESLAAQGVKFTTEGLVTRSEKPDTLFVVGAKTGHQVDPESARILKAFRDERAARGADLFPKTVKFTTSTLKYNKAAWISIEALARSDQKATIDATIDGDLATIHGENVVILAVDRGAAERVKIGDETLPLRDAVKGLLPDVYYRKLETGWAVMDYETSRALQENAARVKRPRLQGPIDDAFTSAFLVVRPTGTARNPNVASWTKSRLERFAAEWSEFFRGDLPIVDDTAVTPDDIATKNLILFGDPGSNRLIARLLPELGLKWSETEIELGGRYPAADHVPSLIAPNPLNRIKYVVLNSGPTFSAADLRGTNALLFPHLGDWAVLRIASQSETVEASGICDSRWRIP